VRALGQKKIIRSRNNSVFLYFVIVSTFKTYKSDHQSIWPCHNGGGYYRRIRWTQRTIVARDETKWTRRKTKTTTRATQIRSKNRTTLKTPKAI